MTMQQVTKKQQKLITLIRVEKMMRCENKKGVRTLRFDAEKVLSIIANVYKDPQIQGALLALAKCRADFYLRAMARA